MKEPDIINLMNQPAMIDNADVEQLKNLIRKYPFFQTAHILLLKCLKIKNSDDFESQLHQSSIHISDRNLLFNYLNQDVKPIIESIPKKLVTEKVLKIRDINDVQKKVEPDPKLLKSRNVRRKINDSFEGMGENISETILSQLEFSVLKDENKLEYSSEIYFIEEERSGKNNVLTIEVNPDQPKGLLKKNDILQIDEVENIIEDVKNPSEQDQNMDDSFELIESEKIEESDLRAAQIKNGVFNIKNYEDKDVINQDNDLIAKFIHQNPRIKPVENTIENVDISEDSIKEDQTLLSETLVKVYIQQGLFEKAIESYQKLCLKYPEKRTYFASQIKNLEDKLNKQ